MKNKMAVLALVLAAAPLAACYVEPAPPPPRPVVVYRPAPPPPPVRHWVPGQYGPNGYWIPGHWQG